LYQLTCGKSFRAPTSLFEEPILARKLSPLGCPARFAKVILIRRKIILNQKRKGGKMKFYTQQHGYYCGIDLHARKMYVCILNHKGKVMIHENIKTDPELFFELIFPFIQDVVVGVECVFCWYQSAPRLRPDKLARRSVCRSQN
jgi:hypothetical protein